jgi:O-succinylbenzoic acid--coA ligase
MPLDYIAGKMVVVRTLERGMQLLSVKPSGHPLSSESLQQLENPERPITFAAMVPLQVYNSLQIPEERKRLMQIKHLIIGGGAIDEKLSEELKNFPNAVWSTYGMTETLSHIALRRLNGPQATEWYTPFEGIEVCLNHEKCLTIHAPAVCNQTLITNDIAELQTFKTDENEAFVRFRIIGRKDNVIDSGGVKIQIEEVERTLKPHLTGDFAITSITDEKFGEAVVLLTTLTDITIVDTICKKILPKFWQPRHIFHTDNIPQTETGKPARANIRQLARQINK